MQTAECRPKGARALNPLRMGAWALACCALACCVAGCGGPNVAEVTGTVVEGGRPVADAWVKFSPLAGGRPAHDRTDPQGRFELRYLDVAGAPVGAYRVQAGTGGAVDNRGNPLTRVVERYSEELTVEPGENDFTIELAPGR